MHPDDLEHLENGGVQNASFLQEDHERISADQLALFIGDTDWAYIQYALALDLTLARKQRDDARAELARMKAVVEAAREWRRHHSDSGLWREHGDYALADAVRAYEKGETT